MVVIWIGLQRLHDDIRDGSGCGHLGGHGTRCSQVSLLVCLPRRAGAQLQTFRPCSVCEPIHNLPAASTVDSIVTHTPSGTFYDTSIVLHGIAVMNYHKCSNLFVEYH